MARPFREWGVGLWRFPACLLRGVGARPAVRASRVDPSAADMAVGLAFPDRAPVLRRPAQATLPPGVVAEAITNAGSVRDRGWDVLRSRLGRGGRVERKAHNLRRAARAENQPRSGFVELTTHISQCDGAAKRR